MPNYKGGKAYKKKKGGDQANTIIQIDRQPDQQLARVIRVLGNRNMLCYCNDNLIRVCHVRGKLRNRVYIELGDVILISLRDYEATVEDAISDSAMGASSSQPTPAIPLMPGEAKVVKEEKKEAAMRGDILAKYPLEYLSKLKKEDGVNPRLFLQLETMGDKNLATIGGKKVEEDGGYEFEREGDETESSESSGGGGDDDVDIDAI
jgi:initiation factor 1A